jgi:DNA-binding GntR family transcriptional regulator
VKTVWPQEFSVAQASVREAINLLITAFLVKDAGRSPRVVNYREQGVRHIYEVRAAIRRARGTIGLLQRIGSFGR